MTILEFEQKIKREIHPDLTIRLNPNATDIAGVYVGDAYVGVALPPREIMETTSQFYMDDFGTPYRGIKEAMTDIRAKLKTMNIKYNLLTSQEFKK